jgi:hypothetical protein
MPGGDRVDGDVRHKEKALPVKGLNPRVIIAAGRVRATSHQPRARRSHRRRKNIVGKDALLHWVQVRAGTVLQAPSGLL